MCGNFFKHGIGSVIAKVLPVAAAFIPGVGPLASAALAAGAGTISSRLQNDQGGWGNALKAGAMSGLGAAVAPIAGNAFSGAFPETAASLGISPSSTVFDSLGINAGSGIGQTLGLNMPSTAAMASHLGGLGAAADMQSASPIAADFMRNNMPSNVAGMGSSGAGGSLESVVSNGAGSAAGSAASGGSGLLSKIPVVGSLLSKAGDWAAANPIPTALGAASIYSGVKSNADRAKQQKQAEDEINNKNATDLNNWRLTLKSPPLARTWRGTNGQTDFSDGDHGEQSYYDNNRIYPGNYAGGGKVRDLGAMEPDTGPVNANDAAQRAALMDRLRKKAAIRYYPPTDEPDDAPIGKKKGGKVKKMAKGGFPRKQGKIAGPGGGMDDKIKAMLSDGEYVIPADVVAHLGDGSNDHGASVLDQIISNIRSQKTGKVRQPNKMNQSALQEEVA